MTSDGGFNIPDEVLINVSQFTNFIIMQHNYNADQQQFMAKETQSIPDINDWYKTLESIYGWAVLMYNTQDMDAVSSKFERAQYLLDILNTKPSNRKVRNSTQEIARALINSLSALQVHMRLRLQWRNKFFIKYGYSSQTTSEVIENYFKKGGRGGSVKKGGVKEGV